MYRAIMICDLKNPVSVAYSKIAMKTWEPVAGVTVERWQCYTPDTIDDAPFKINWGRYSSAGKYQKDKHEITPTEKACLTSMFHWWKHTADTGERVIILEHDAFVRDPEQLERWLKIMDQFDLWNPGIAMECASMSQQFAKYCMQKWLALGDVIDAGPMAELFTCAQEWDKILKLYNNRIERETRKALDIKSRSVLLWPTVKSNNTLCAVSHSSEVMKPATTYPAPVTQVYCPGKNTLEHHKKKGQIGYGDTTYRQMEIIDDLKAEAKKVDQSS